MGIGVAGYWAYRRHCGLDLRERRDPAVETGPGVEVAFRSILIPVNTDECDLPWDILEVAARLAGGQRARIVLFLVTEVPLSEEVDVEMPGLEERVGVLAGQARTFAEEYGIRVHATHVRTRDAAESILAEARRRSSQAILLGATGRRRADSRRFARDQVSRRIVAEAGVRVMFVQPEPTAA
jgi:nucleotide-binding universal stress UspA family protein